MNKDPDWMADFAYCNSEEGLLRMIVESVKHANGDNREVSFNSDITWVGGLNVYVDNADRRLSEIAQDYQQTGNKEKLVESVRLLRQLIEETIQSR